MAEDNSSSGKATPPFLVKTYNMVEDQLCDEFVCWADTDGFVVKRELEFAKYILPRYFKHSNVGCRV